MPAPLVQVAEGRYEVRVPKEESDLVGDLRYSWRKLKKLAADVGDSLATLQVNGGEGCWEREGGVVGRWASGRVGKHIGRLCCHEHCGIVLSFAPSWRADCLCLAAALPCPARATLPSHRPQVGFKRTLLQEVKLFVVDAVAFRQDWEANGPTVPGLDPMDATDRLRKFQQLFEVGGGARAGGLRPEAVAAHLAVASRRQCGGRLSTAAGTL